MMRFLFEMIISLMIYQHNDLSISHTATINSEDETVQMETERYMGDAGLEKWVVRCGNYYQRGGMRIPTLLKCYGD